MNRNDLESLRHFIDTALNNGWSPCYGAEQGTFIILDPACVRVQSSKSTSTLDNDAYIDWLAPLSDIELAQAAWGKKLIGSQVAWQYHQHKLLDLLQLGSREAYFEYLYITE